MQVAAQYTKDSSMLHSSKQHCVERAAVYEIRVQGELDDGWTGWFDDGQRVSGLDIRAERGVTTLRGRVADQPALFGLLIKIRDLSLALLSVNLIESCAKSST
jgi:hypothetical protein